MIFALLVVHLVVTLALIAIVLIQRSEGGGLGIGATQGMGSFMSGRGTANLLTRGTSILAAIFMALSLLLAVLNRGTAGVGNDILATPRSTSHASPTSLAPTVIHPHPTAPPAAPPNAPAVPTR